MKRIPNLDLLRTFLALEVVVFHYVFIVTGKHIYIPIPPVAGFIALSGFLIPQSFDTSNNWGHFAWKRILRIVPALLFSFFMVYFLYGFDKLRPTLLTYFTAGVLGAGLTMNRSLWSLMIEEVLYAYHCFRFTITKRYALISVIFMFILCEIIRYAYPARGYMFGLGACFFAGNLIYLLRDRIRLPFYWFAALIPMSATIYFNRPFFYHFDVPISVGMLLLAIHLPQVRFRFPDLSYGLYIYHWPLIEFIVWYSDLAKVPAAIFSVIVVFVIVISSWYGIEKPALRLKNIQVSLRLSTVKASSRNLMRISSSTVLILLSTLFSSIRRS